MTTQKKVQCAPVTETQPAVKAETFTTDDLQLCAALVCAGHALIKIDDVFVLRRDDRIERDARAYWLNTLILPARAYSDEIEWLMSELFED